MAGCKQRGWDDPRALVEVGATVSRRRAPADRRQPLATSTRASTTPAADVLLVSTAGMLVRRSVLDHVGGFDPAIPLVGDDVDLCMRVRRAGHRVAVVPTAVVRHAQALERGQRPADALHGRLARRLGAPAPRAGRDGGLEAARRRHWLHARLVQAPALLLPLLWLWVVAVAPVRALVWAVRGHPGRAGAELAAAGQLLGRGRRVGGSRWRSRRSRAVPSSALRTLQRSRAQVLREDVDAWRATRSVRRQDDRDDDAVPLAALESGPVDDDTIDLDLGASGPARRFFGHPHDVPAAARPGAGRTSSAPVRDHARRPWTATGSPSPSRTRRPASPPPSCGPGRRPAGATWGPACWARRTPPPRSGRD